MKKEKMSWHWQKTKIGGYKGLIHITKIKEKLLLGFETRNKNSRMWDKKVEISVEDIGA